MIHQERLVSEFIELVKIGSESKREGTLCRVVEQKLRKVGAKVLRDKSGDQIGSNGSNIIAKINGDENLPPLLLNAHLDTVVPGENVHPIREGEVIKSDGTTVLGADNKAGIAIILEVLKVLGEKKIIHPPIDVVFTICEEIGLLGAKELDFSLIDAKYGYSLDGGDIDILIQGAPSQNSIFIKIYGIEAHAGTSPEQGISAIEVAGKAVSRLKLGRIDEETTSNIGKIKGGSATNIVPGYTEIEGEIRSHSEEKLNTWTNQMIKTFNQAANESGKVINNKKLFARIDEKVTRAYTRFYISQEDSVVQNVIKAGSKLKINIQTKRGGGGSDANIFNEHGIKTVIIGTGMQKVHTKQEFVKIKDLVLGGELLLEVLRNSAKLEE
jgi:tripeptide aminopeptidase